MNLDNQVISHKKELISYLLNQTNRDFELSNDLFQDLFIKVRKTVKNGKYIEEGKLVHWLKRIARNLVIDHYRRESKMSFIRENDEYNPIKRLPDDSDDYSDTWVTDEQSLSLRKAVDSLPEAQKELIDMRFYRNMSYKEIVEETGEKQSNLLPRMHYTIRKLQKQLC